MKLYLVRHGEAVHLDMEGDPPLSPKGCHDVRQIAARLVEEGVRVDQILHSFKLRAAQTAGILASELADTVPVKEKSGLGPSDQVDPLLDEIVDWNDDCMVVGHLPFLQKLCAGLVADTGSDPPFRIPTGSVICFESGKEDSWVFRWIVRPEP